MSTPCATPPRAPFGAREVPVLARSESGPYVLLRAADNEGPLPAAGQFYMLRSAERWGAGTDGRPWLPRALSFARAESAGGGAELEFMLEAVGPGTERLAELAPGGALVISGPFGNSFKPASERLPLLVGGGVGLAPVLALDAELKSAGRERRTLVGMRSGAHAAVVAALGLEAQIATDDGSAGHDGLVTDLLLAELEKTDDVSVHACGPPPMLEAVRALCAERGVRAELALEAPMACGFGSCHGCVVPTRDGYKRVCVDGPVFDAAELESALAPEPA